MELSKTKFIAEIGAGNGNLMLLLKHHFNSKCIINIDLPETLIMSIPFLANLFPNAKILLPNEIGLSDAAAKKLKVKENEKEYTRYYL